MERVASWNNIGMDISKETRLDDVLLKAKLNYNVSKEPIFTSFSGNQIIVPNRSATIRDDGHVYGVVSDRYEIIQNKDAFDFINYIDQESTYVKAGETASGSVYIIKKLDDVNILGDAFTPYLIFRNSFNGYFPLQVAICPLRIVCQNQFNMAFADASNTISIRHSHSAVEKMAEAQRILSATSDYMKELTKEAEKYASIKLTSNNIAMIVNQLFPIYGDMSEKQSQKAVEAKERFLKAFNANDNGNVKGTAWGLINAYTDFITHSPILRNTQTSQENRFTAVTFDPKLMNHFMKVLNQEIKNY